jgi:hypothetical protein
LKNKRASQARAQLNKIKRATEAAEVAVEVIAVRTTTTSRSSILMRRALL